MAILAKTEPKLDPAPAEASREPAPAVSAPVIASTPVAASPSVPSPPVPAPAAAPPPPAAPAPQADRLDQLSRVEDKTSRIEEKFARAEERMMRVESALEKATLRLEGVSQEMNLQALKDDISAMRGQLRRKPGAATIFIVSLVSALIGAAILFALLRYGIPGVMPPVLPR